MACTALSRAFFVEIGDADEAAANTRERTQALKMRTSAPRRVPFVRFTHTYHPRLNVTALVDFDNDCVGTSLACARALGDRLWGVRLDTAETLVDRSLWAVMGGFPPTGVAPELVRRVRRALDAEGFQRVRIVVSGGFTAERIAAFEAACVPADAYGVGSSLLQGVADFTADIVRVEGEPCAKVGRVYRPDARLEIVE